MPKTVLLVEDEDSIAYALQFLIERDGLKFRRAVNIEAARQVMRDAPPDLVLLDIMLPGGSGYELCQDIRLDPNLASTKILMLTAGGDPMARRKSLALGADAFLAKPFSNTEIQTTVAALLAEEAV